MRQPFHHLTTGEAREAFWAALANLDIDAIDGRHLDRHQREFITGVRFLLDGALPSADSVFRTVYVSSPDTLLREASRIALTAILQYESEWHAIALLPRAISPGDTVGKQRAAVETWAEILRSVPATRITFPERPVTLRLESSPFRTPIVTVRINGIEKHFWLDTGATLSLVSSDLAVACGLVPLVRDTLAVVASTARHVSVIPTVIHRLELGGLAVTNLPAMIVNTDDLRLPDPTNPQQEWVQLDGIIGADIIRHLDLEIDVERGRVTIRDPRLAEPARVRNLFWFGYPVVRLMAENDTPVYFGLDTGAQESFVTPSIFREGRKRRFPVRRMLIGGVGGTLEDRLSIIPELSLRVHRQPLRFVNLTIRGHRRLIFLEPDGILGSDMNRVGRVRIDMTNGVFSITPAPPPIGVIRP